MTCFICTACGTQFADRPEPPPSCPVCEDERQFVPESGQGWTDMAALGRDHAVAWRREAEGLHSLQLEPAFAIGQRAFLVEGPGEGPAGKIPYGNILWDCLSLVDDASVARIRAAGGVAAIAISHPHFYSAMAEWSRALGGVPVHVHADDAEWVQRPFPALRPWAGDTLALGGGATLIRCGGHFAGSAVLHVPWLQGGEGALLVGDTMQVVADRRHVGFMRSYPNLIPLGAGAVRRIAAAVKQCRFAAIHGGFAGRSIAEGGAAAVERSAERHLRWVAE